MRLVTEATENRKHGLPDLPYKGLNYYDITDIPIFAGREDDITRCARLVQLPRTKLLFLHGSTGCGKSSFVRAGLIPFLERRELGYSFVREDEAELMSHFIRSTDDPFSRLAEVLFQLGQTRRTRITPIGPSTVDLSECVQPDQFNLQRFIGRSPVHMLEVLSRFALKIPETLVLIFDQIEEVLTLRPGQNGDRSRLRFFEFLDLFMDAGIDIKIVLALRTEYFGRVLDLLHYNISDAGAIGYYLLKDLSEQELIRAIVRPTSDVDEGYGSPRKKYGFRYAPGVPQAIARDLKRAIQAGGALPVMQLVCGRLYDAVRATRTDENAVDITFEHYRGLGGVQGQINGHLKDVLDRMFVDSAVSGREFSFESGRWRRLLLTLAKVQVDGTVTTEMRPIADFVEDAEKANCSVPAKEGIDFLIRKENRVLRDVAVYNAAQRKEIPCLALGHDAIGLALAKGLSSKDVGERILQNTRSIAKLCAAGLLLGVSLLDLAHITTRSIGWAFIRDDVLLALNLVGVLYTGIVSFIAFMPVWIFVHICELGARSYGLLGLTAAAERLAAIAEELKQGQPKEKIDPRALLMLTDKNTQGRRSKKSLRKAQAARFVKIDPADAPWLRSALTFLNLSLKSIDRAERALRLFARMITSSGQNSDQKKLRRPVRSDRQKE